MSKCEHGEHIGNSCPFCENRALMSEDPSIHDAVESIQFCISKLKQHRDHWTMTKSLSVLPSYGQCGSLIEELEKAVSILKLK